MPVVKVENETKINEQQGTDKAPIDEFLEAAKEVKKNTVPQEEFDKVKSENTKLKEFILEGGNSPVAPETPKRSRAELLKVIENEDSNNLEFTKASLELRQQVLDEGGRDPFLPNSSQTPITTADVEGAERVASVLQECVDESEGDPETFNFLFGKRVNDSSPLLNAKVKAMAKKGK